ncbi:MAG: hypothetical protein E2O39_14250 [Planctomycetota bacterium]|nr:MAG: hypothetical protein E2O39_14250 [Planctomycetota bacterium]
MEALNPARNASRPFLTALLLACTALGAPARAQAPAPDPAATEAEEDARTLDRRRLLTLVDGTVLRARSRFTGERWERRDGSDWIPIEGSVLRYRLEREVVAEARRMASGVGAREHARRVALARWMVGQGLYDEAVAELDRVFARSPDDARALQLVLDVRIPIELAATDPVSTVKALVIAGAKGTQARREIAVQRLAELVDRALLRQLVAAELAGMQQGRRAFMTLVARRLFPGELLRELSSRAILDGARRVREGAALALRDAGDVAVLGPPINALASTFPSVRSNAAEALGNIGHPAAVQPLITHLASLSSSRAPVGTRANVYIGEQTAYVMDYDVEIALGAAIADPIVAVVTSGIVFDVRTVVQMTKTIERRRVIGSLEQLTGANPGPGAQAWLDWWEEHGDDWRSRELAQRQPTTPGR